MCATPISLLGLELHRTALLPLARDQCQRHDTTDVHLGAKDLGVKTELLCRSLEVFKTLLVVGTGTTDPNLSVVLNESLAVLPKSLDDTLESASDVGEVGNTTADEEDLALLRHRSTEHKVENSAGVVVGLRLGGSTRVLTVVGKLISKTSRGDGIGVDHGGTTTGNKSPDTAIGVQDSKLERGTSLGIKLSNVSLLLGELTAEGSGELNGRAGIDVDTARALSNNAQGGGRTGDSPFVATLEVGRLVELSSKIEEVNLSRGGILVGNDNQGVDLEVGELAVHVDGIETGNCKRAVSADARVMHPPTPDGDREWRMWARRLTGYRPDSPVKLKLTGETY